MTILLTGATGFLGSHLLEAFLKQNYDVIVVKRTFSDTKRIEKFLSNCKIYEIDKTSLETIFQENKIDAIVHTATDYGKNKEFVSDIFESNFMFPVKLIDFAIKYGVETFVNTDSYFSKDDVNYSYLSNYSLSKKILRTYLKSLNGKIKVVNAVIEHLYGENDREDKFVAQMMRKIAIEQVGSVDLTLGEQKKDFVYVKDVVNAYLKMLEFAKQNSFDFKSFDIGYGESVSVKDFVLAIKKISKSSTELNFGVIPYREDEIMCFSSDNTELLKIGWEPEFSYVDGIKDMISKELYVQ